MSAGTPQHRDSRNIVVVPWLSKVSFRDVEAINLQFYPGEPVPVYTVEAGKEVDVVKEASSAGGRLSAILCRRARVRVELVPALSERFRIAPPSAEHVSAR